VHRAHLLRRSDDRPIANQRREQTPESRDPPSALRDLVRLADLVGSGGNARRAKARREVVEQHVEELTRDARGLEKDADGRRWFT